MLVAVAAAAAVVVAALVVDWHDLERTGILLLLDEGPLPENKCPMLSHDPCSRWTTAGKERVLSVVQIFVHSMPPSQLQLLTEMTRPAGWVVDVVAARFALRFR